MLVMLHPVYGVNFLQNVANLLIIIPYPYLSHPILLFVIFITKFAIHRSSSSTPGSSQVILVRSIY